MDTNNGAASAAVVNFGGQRTEAGAEYIYTLADIKLIPGVIEYPESLKRDDDNKNRTMDSLNEFEQEVMIKAPVVPMTRSDGSEVIGKDGNPIPKPKITDVIQFVFTNDSNGSSTGPYDFMFRCYAGKLEFPYTSAFRVQKDLKAFLKVTKGVDPETLSGSKSLWDIYKKGDKFVIATKPELRNGKYVQIDNASIKPYKDGMKLKTSSTTNTSELDDNLLALLKDVSGKLEINQIMDEKIATKLGASKEDVVASYRRLVASGCVVQEGGKIVAK